MTTLVKKSCRTALQKLCRADRAGLLAKLLPGFRARHPADILHDALYDIVLGTLYDIVFDTMYIVHDALHHTLHDTLHDIVQGVRYRFV